MILRRVWKYSFNPRNFASGCIDFVFSWIQYRSPLKLVLGALPVAFSACLLFLFWRSNTEDYRTGLLARYDVLATDALEQGLLEESELFFARSVSLASDPDKRSFEIALKLYKRGNFERSQAILQVLAPLGMQRYIPAHQFLAKHWKSQPKQTDVTRAIAMYHDMHASDNDEGPRLRLAKFLSDRGHQEEALNCLDGVVNPSPQLRLQLVQIYIRSANPRGAVREAKAVETELRGRLSENETDDRSRILLSRAIACQGRLLDAMFVLAEGCVQRSAPSLADELIKSYGIWLSTMSPELIRRQLDQIALALEIEDSDQDDADLTLQNGTNVSVPFVIAQLHRHVLQGEGNWLIPLLQGTHLASSQDYAGALERLQHSLQLRSDNSLVANNLAWTMMQLNVQASEDNRISAEQRDTKLNRAWELANTAVNNHPDEPAFRETRGQLAAHLNRWDEAVQDLSVCVDMGHSSPAIQSTLIRAKAFQ